MVPPKQTLWNNGVRIEPNPNEITQLPKYAKDVRDLLLNFEKILAVNEKPNLKNYYHQDLHIDRNAPPLDSTIYLDSGHRSYRTRWEAATALRNASKGLSDRLNEANWTLMLANFAFQNFNEQSSDKGIILRDMISWDSNHLFGEAVSIRGLLSDNEAHKPKPDYLFGLGLYEEKQLLRMKGIELSDPGIEYFTQDNLRELSMTYPDSFVYQVSSTKEGAGFPWMVVECKHEKGDEKECLRQAANGCHTILEFYDIFAAIAAQNRSLQSRRPPIIALTSVGPKVKIFIAHRSVSARSSGRGHYYRMSCIWEGNVEHILYAVQLRRIMDQLMFWALRIFKPWVTECLELWYEQASNEGSEEERNNEDSSGDDSLGSEVSDAEREDGNPNHPTPPSTPPRRSPQTPGSSSTTRWRS